MDAVQRRGSPERLSYIKRFGCTILVFLICLSLLPPPRAQAVAVVDDVAILITSIMQSFGMHITSDAPDNLWQDIVGYYDQYSTELGGPTFAEKFESWWEECTTSSGADGMTQMELGSMFSSDIIDFIKWFGGVHKIEPGLPFDIPIIVGSGADMALTVEDGKTYIGGYLINTAQNANSYIVPSKVGKYVLFSSFPDFYVERTSSKVYVHSLNGNEYEFPSNSTEQSLNFRWQSWDSSFAICCGHSLGSTWNYPKFITVNSPALVAKLAAVYLAGPGKGITQITSKHGVSIPALDKQKGERLAISFPVPYVPGQTASDVIDGFRDHAAAGDKDVTSSVAGATDVPVTGEMVGDISISDVEVAQPSLSALYISKFPFCIPWDIYNAIKLLAMPSETPRWEVDFLEPLVTRYGLGIDTTVVIDFADFELLGQLTRWLSTLLFVGMLASGTKRLIWS